MSDGQKQKIRESLLARGKSPTKKCPRCEETKPREDFGVRKNGHSRARCRPCEVEEWKEWQIKNPDKVRESNRRASLHRWFGITVEQYDALLAEQNGVCAICGGVEASRHGYLYVDHCHVTGRIRGLLCSACNSALGMIRDDPARLRRAIAYLEAPVPENALHAKPGMPSGNRAALWAPPKASAAAS